MWYQKERKMPEFQKIKVIQDISWPKRLVDVQIFNGFHYKEISGWNDRKMTKGC